MIFSDDLSIYLSSGSKFSCGIFISDCFGIFSNNTNVCNKHGTCVGKNLCNCNTGWYGSECKSQKFICFLIQSTDEGVCNKHGICVDNDKCICNTGYQGIQCNQIDTIMCFNRKNNDDAVCNAHGSCVSFNNCSCNFGWKGDQCQTQIVSLVKQNLKCWGDNEKSQLLTGDNFPYNTPKIINFNVKGNPLPINSIKSVSVSYSTCGINNDDIVYCWGSNRLKLIIIFSLIKI
jgi:uncharacterized protein involved in tolerance to divalent cations